MIYNFGINSNTNNIKQTAKLEQCYYYKLFRRSRVGIKLSLVLVLSLLLSLSSIANSLGFDVEVVKALLLMSLAIMLCFGYLFFYILASLRFILWIMLALFFSELIFANFYSAVSSSVSIFLVVYVSQLAMLTTKLSEFIDFWQQLLSPLQRVGVRSDLLALAFGLVIRFMAIWFEAFTNIRQQWLYRKGIKKIKLKDCAIILGLVILLVLRQARYFSDSLTIKLNNHVSDS